MNYLSVESISKSFGLTRLFEGITFGLEKGQKMALIAHNGAGKTTLLKILAGLESPDSGEVAIKNDIKIGFLEQVPELNDKHTIIEEVSDADNPQLKAVQAYEKALLNIDDAEAFNKALQAMDDLQAWDVEASVKRILGKLDLYDLTQSIHNLSGGQKKRVALAKILINEPDLLIMDEPTNHLDLKAIQWLEDFLETENITLLMVTHDRYFLDRVCNYIVEIDRNQLFTYKGNYSYYLEKKEEMKASDAATLAKNKNLFSKELQWIRRQPKARGTKAKYRVDAFDELKKKIQNKPNESGLELDVIGKRTGKKILELKHLDKAYSADYKILDDFSYVFKKREKIGILGDNGVGKSTFLKVITGEIEADAGEVIKGDTINFGFYKQDGLVDDSDNKVIDVVKEIAEVINLSNGKILTASQLLERFLFSPEKQYQPVRTLSGGEKKRLYLCTILIQNPNFLILDEPTNDLDIVTLNVLEDFLMQFDGCVIIISHDRYFMDKIVDHMFIFEGQGIIRDFNGTCSDYLEYKEFEGLESKKESTSETSSAKKDKEKDVQKMSYKEKLEFEGLEAEIEQLENQKSELETKLNTETNSTKIQELSQRYGEVSNTLEDKSMRWLELSEKEG